VVRDGAGELVTYAVERVLGQQEIVVRPLADPLVSSAAISGSTDLGDGRATIVLDLLALATQLGPRNGREGQAA
jgi:two-component system chemotaxis sensor kinase CheA